ncbi:MAG: hypothetical protein CM15mP62_14480 [Rhodospirillaceae bacterium]|nr:MAG: hypothetical protein CM15mP62_14480 [Rhodospirillaceae bacterium]
MTLDGKPLPRGGVIRLSSAKSSKAKKILLQKPEEINTKTARKAVIIRGKY